MYLKKEKIPLSLYKDNLLVFIKRQRTTLRGGPGRVIQPVVDLKEVEMNEQQLSKPLTVVKQTFFVIVSLIIVAAFVALFFTKVWPIGIALWVGTVAFVCMKNLTVQKPYHLNGFEMAGAMILSPLSVALWLGICLTNMVSGDGFTAKPQKA